ARVNCTGPAPARHAPRDAHSAQPTAGASATRHWCERFFLALLSAGARILSRTPHGWRKNSFSAPRQTGEPMTAAAGGRPLLATGCLAPAMRRDEAFSHPRGEVYFQR